MIPIYQPGTRDLNGYMTAEPDDKGNYVLFSYRSSSTDSYEFMQVNLKLDPKLVSKMAGGSPASLATLVIDALDEGELSADQELKIEYVPATALQSEGVRIQSASGTVWTCVEDADRQSRYWSPIEKYIQEDQYGAFASQGSNGKRLIDVINPELPNPESVLRSVSYKHQVGDQCYGIESAQQSAMLSLYISNAQALCDSLEAHKDSLDQMILENYQAISLVDSSDPGGAARDAQLKQEISQYQEQKKLTDMQLDFQKQKLQVAKDFLSKTGNEMVDSNYFRDLLKEVTAEHEKLTGLAKKDFIQADFDEVYNKACERYIPALCNFWKQEARGQYMDPSTGMAVTDADSWMRLGAFYDTRSGLFTSINFFDPFTGALKSDAEIQSEAQKVLKKLQDERAHLSRQLPENLGFIKRIRSKMTKPAYLGCLSAINWLEKRIDPKATGTVDIDALKQLLMERKVIQESAFLSLLEHQVSRLNPGDDTLKWLHVSLLKPFEGWKKADQTGAPGWTHHEQNEISEMQWVFRHFRGAKIHFGDCPGSTRIEYNNEGKPSDIYLGSQLAPAGFTGKIIDLESHFVSCSVAAGSKADGHGTEEGRNRQSDINGAFFKYALAPGGDLTSKTVAKSASREGDPIDALEQGYSTFEAAEEISHYLLSKGWAISGGCQSGKDRTGFWSSRLAQKKILGTYDSHPPKEESKRTRQLLDENPLRGKRVTTQILEANTGKTAIKVGVLSLPGYDGVFKQRRLGHYATLLYEQFFQKKAAKVQAVVKKNFTI